MKKLILLAIFVSSFSSFAKEPFAPKNFERPTREISIIVSNEGYYPKRISAFVGESIRFFVTSTSDQKNCLLLQNHKVFMAAQKGEVTEGHAFLDKPGKFKFYCPANKKEGTLTVLEKVKPIEEVKEIEELRKPASVSPGYWTPRDYDRN